MGVPFGVYVWVCDGKDTTMKNPDCVTDYKVKLEDQDYLTVMSRTGTWEGELGVNNSGIRTKGRSQQGLGS